MSLSVLNVKKCAKKLQSNANKMHIKHIYMFEVGCVQIIKFPSYCSAEKKTVQNIDFPDCYSVPSSIILFRLKGNGFSDIFKAVKVTVVIKKNCKKIIFYLFR